MPHSDRAMINRLLPSFGLEVALIEWQLEKLIKRRVGTIEVAVFTGLLSVIRWWRCGCGSWYSKPSIWIRTSSWNVLTRWKSHSRFSSIRPPINPPLQSHLNPYHAAYFVVHFVVNHLLFAKEVLVYLDASLQEVWIFAELQICLVHRVVSKIPVSFERLPNMAPFNILLALLERPWIWNICPSPEGQFVWIVQNFQMLSARFATPIPRSIPMTTIVEHLPSCYWDGLRRCWMHVLTCCRTRLHNLYPRARSPKLKKKILLYFQIVQNYKCRFYCEMFSKS